MAVDMYLKIEGIEGESTDDKHAKWSEITNYSFGVNQPVSGASRTGGRTGGGANFGDFIVRKTVDAATPDLYIYCCSGKHIAKVEIECCLATGDKHVFMKYEMEDVIISGVDASGVSQDDIRPSETLKLNFGKIKWEYTPIDQKGSPGAATDRTWDRETNKQA